MSDLRKAAADYQSHIAANPGPSEIRALGIAHNKNPWPRQ